MLPENKKPESPFVDSLAARQQISNLKHAHRLEKIHNHAALMDHLRLMRENVTLVPNANYHSYACGWRAAIETVMNNVPLP